MSLFNSRDIWREEKQNKKKQKSFPRIIDEA